MQLYKLHWEDIGDIVKSWVTGVQELILRWLKQLPFWKHSLLRWELVVFALTLYEESDCDGNDGGDTNDGDADEGDDDEDANNADDDDDEGDHSENGCREKQGLTLRWETINAADGLPSLPFTRGFTQSRR